MKKKQMDKQPMNRQQRREWYLTFMRELRAKVDDDREKAWVSAKIQWGLYGLYLDYVLHAVETVKVEEIVEMMAEIQQTMERGWREHFRDIGEGRSKSKGFRPSRN